MLPNGGGGYHSNNMSIQAIIDAANKYGVDPSIPLSIAGWETRGAYNASSYNASDWNGYASVGLFQLNMAPHNPGWGYSVAQLEDPHVNADIAVSKMQAAYNAGTQKGLSGTSLLDYVANNSGWPDSAGVSVANSAEPSYDRGLNAFYNAGNFSTPSTFTGPTGQVGSGSQQANTTPYGFPTGTDPITIIDQSTKLHGFSVLHPAQSITQDAGAIALRSVLVVVGLVLIIFALAALIKKVV